MATKSTKTNQKRTTEMPQAAGENRLEIRHMSANNGTAQATKVEANTETLETLETLETFETVEAVEAVEPVEVNIVEQIDNALGIYAVPDYEFRAWVKVYYALREMQGKFLRRQYGESFNWDLFKAQYAAVFGTEKERKVSLEVMLKYARTKFNKSLGDLIVANNQSFHRREGMKRKMEADYNPEWEADYNPNWQ